MKHFVLRLALPILVFALHPSSQAENNNPPPTTGPGDNTTTRPSGRVVNVHVIAINGEPAEGTGDSTTYQTVGLPVLNRYGRVLFGGALTGPGIDFLNDDVLWLEEPDSSLRVVAREGTQAPGMSPGWLFQGLTSSSPFTSFGQPLVDGGGNVTFNARIYNQDSLFGVTGLWTGPSGAPGLVAKHGDVLPSPWGPIQTGPFDDDMRMSGTGGVSFANPGEGHLWRYDVSGGLSFVLFSATDIPGLDTIWQYGPTIGHVVNDDGVMAFMTTYDSGGISRGMALYRIAAGVPTEVSSYLTGVPGGAGGEVFNLYASIMINARGHVAFRGSVLEGGFARPLGVWAERDGGLEPVIRLNTQAPGTPGGTVFGEFLGAGINWWDVYFTDRDRIVAKVKLSGAGVTTVNDVGVWREGEFGPELVAREGEQVRGLAEGITFDVIERLISNKSGDVVILGTIAGPGISTANNRGIWALGEDTSFVPVVVKGEKLLTKGGALRTVYNLQVAGGSFENTGNGNDGRASVLNAAKILTFKSQFFDVTEFREAICEVDLSNIIRSEYLPVRVVQRDSAGSLVPLPNFIFEAGKYTPQDPFDPFLFTKARLSDSNGVIFLDTSIFDPGDPFLLRFNAYTEHSPKSGRGAVDDAQFEVTLDNLVMKPSGLFDSDSLSPVADDTTFAVLGHATIRLHLVVSIEWAAEESYVDSLLAALRHAANYLYDVTNGQACFGKIAVYDNGAHWTDADIRIHASNLVWPAADIFGLRAAVGAVNFPPKWYGGDTRNLIFPEHPLNPNHSYVYRTIVHELGHYAFGFLDEYVDAGNTPVGAGVNYGYMDYHYPTAGDPMTSEMSLALPAGYEMTAQFQHRSKSTWNFFDTTFSRTFGPARVDIRTPAETGTPPGLPYIPGPNDNPELPDVAIGRDAEYQAGHTGSTLPGKALIYIAPGGGRAANVRVNLLKSAGGRLIDHGATSDSGEIRFLGADFNDRVIGEWKSGKKTYRYRDTLLTPAARPTVSAGPEIAILEEVAGNFTMLSSVAYDGSGNRVYTAVSDMNFSTAPGIGVYGNPGGPFQYVLAGDSAGYSATITDTLDPSAAILFEAPDSLGKPFTSVQRNTIFAIDSTTRELAGSGGEFRLRFDGPNTVLSEIDLLLSDFSAPSGGLPDSAARISPVYSFNGHPSVQPIAGRATFRYGNGYDLPAPPWLENAVVYRWAGSWQPLPTEVDTEHNTASAAITSGGSYAVFTDETLTGVEEERGDVIPREYRLYQNFPNPFNPVTTFRYDLPEAGFVTLTVFNALGQRVGTLVNGETPAGIHSVEWDATGRPSGVYFYTLTAGTFRSVKKMVLLR